MDSSHVTPKLTPLDQELRRAGSGGPFSQSPAQSLAGLVSK
jgi:hypothetical protein